MRLFPGGPESFEVFLPDSLKFLAAGRRFDQGLDGGDQFVLVHVDTLRLKLMLVEGRTFGFLEKTLNRK